MRVRNPDADPAGILPDVHPARIPRHIAVIMDGNGRWASGRGLPRTEGHRAGARSVRTILEESAKLGVEFLTLYSFSSENWRRPEEEVRALMELCIERCHGEQAELSSQGVRVRVIGRREGLPEDVLAALDFVEQATAGGERITLCLAINYGSRGEIVDAARALASDVAAGRLKTDQIDEAAIASRLYTAGMPDPDLLIRTAGEMRISNYLLWQISYSEIHVTDVLWPDFGAADLHAAIRDFASRHRKFGGVNTAADTHG
ncbi:MAG: di-trans,poly-cis-decaprenylcistransferase [Phycisphaerales bacterium]|nr:di-trans,poly-cis-decaprenylcistransferase [Phycisphaerales bacterium]